jgi:hypothetical protein
MVKECLFDFWQRQEFFWAQQLIQCAILSQVGREDVFTEELRSVDLKLITISILCQDQGWWSTIQIAPSSWLGAYVSMEYTTI